MWVHFYNFDKLHVTTLGQGTQAQASGQPRPSLSEELSFFSCSCPLVILSSPSLTGFPIKSVANSPRKALGAKAGKGQGPAVSITWALSTVQGFWRGRGARPHPA